MAQEICIFKRNDNWRKSYENPYPACCHRGSQHIVNNVHVVCRPRGEDRIRSSNEHFDGTVVSFREVLPIRDIKSSYLLDK